MSFHSMGLVRDSVWLSLVMMRRAHSLDHAPFTFLRLVDTALDQSGILWPDLETRTDLNAEILVCVPERGSSPEYYSDYITASTMATAIVRIGSEPEARFGKALRGRILLSALHHCAFLFSDHEYPTWWIANEPTARYSTAKMIFLAYAVFRRQRTEQEVNWSILDALLDRGFLTSKTRTRLLPMPGILDKAVDHTGSSADPNDDPGTVTNTPASPHYSLVELSVWQHYLIVEWLFQHDALSLETESKLSRQEKAAHFGAVVQRFLRRGGVGAESRFAVSVSPDGTRAEFAFWNDSGDGGGAMTETPTVTCWVGLPRGMPLDKVKARDVGIRPAPLQGAGGNGNTSAHSGAGSRDWRTCRTRRSCCGLWTGTSLLPAMCVGRSRRKYHRLPTPRAPDRGRY
ncbi:uncharacterized protein B0T15DRAFT_220123 [Chaetomium strumarium]|uniref:Uncharacterized protein n=1 Tax=Chaetomium strumarium TaxID=1170767 RepID=A0AAJ0GU32_9PEZI|nr:hypothetical protein B0T15DRAFT_220123 [Chaetomium strumarium]